MPLIDDKVRSLVQSIESASDIGSADRYISELVTHLSDRCIAEARKPLGESVPPETDPGAYPVDSEGYAQAFDPLTQEEEYVQFFCKFGFVVGKEVISKDLANRSIQRIKEIATSISEGAFSFDVPDSWEQIPEDAQGSKMLSRGFFEVDHDEIWAEIRQSVRLYIHHVLIWGRADLWTTFDRFGVKLPRHEESKGLPLHIDQSPLLGTEYKFVQGVLALSNCPEESGVTVLVPNSRSKFESFKKYGLPEEEYISFESAQEDELRELKSKLQPIPLRAGDILSWDSRTVHTNTDNTSDHKTRFIAFVSTGISRESSNELVNARVAQFKLGTSRSLRDAYMYATFRPRYDNPAAIASVRKPEKLTLLGRLLYGFEKYATFLV
jgi:ectoine hydroxylase-related dioxygenase (phytanoyl-CoA dioxygenase family)